MNVIKCLSHVHACCKLCTHLTMNSMQRFCERGKINKSIYLTIQINKRLKLSSWISCINTNMLCCNRHNNLQLVFSINLHTQMLLHRTVLHTNYRLHLVAMAARWTLCSWTPSISIISLLGHSDCHFSKEGYIIHNRSHTAHIQ